MSLTARPRGLSQNGRRAWELEELLQDLANGCAKKGLGPLPPQASETPAFPRNGEVEGGASEKPGSSEGGEPRSYLSPPDANRFGMLLMVSTKATDNS